MSTPQSISTPMRAPVRRRLEYPTEPPCLTHMATPQNSLVEESPLRAPIDISTHVFDNDPMEWDSGSDDHSLELSD